MVVGWRFSLALRPTQRLVEGVMGGILGSLFYSNTTRVAPQSRTSHNRGLFKLMLFDFLVIGECCLGGDDGFVRGLIEVDSLREYFRKSEHLIESELLRHIREGMDAYLNLYLDRMMSQKTDYERRISGGSSTIVPFPLGLGVRESVLGYVLSAVYGVPQLDRGVV
ncbi:hypothetical protein Tco_1338552 [Tanacetum coccineum]